MKKILYTFLILLFMVSTADAVRVKPVNRVDGGDHGTLSGLSDDDHTQYGNLSQDESVTGEWTFTKTITLTYGAVSGVLTVDANGKVTPSSTIDLTELGYLNGQDQGMASTDSPTHVGLTLTGANTGTVAYFDSTGKLLGDSDVTTTNLDSISQTTSKVLENADLGVTVQEYDADTTKNDVANTFTLKQTFDVAPVIDSLTQTNNVRTNMLKNSGFDIWSNGSATDYGTQFAANSLLSISSGVVSCTQTNLLAVDSLIKFTGSDPIGGNTYKVTAVVANTSFTIHDTSITMASVTQTAYQQTPGCIGADAYAMDGWYKTSNTNIDLYREPNGSNTQDGSYFALKVVTADAGPYYVMFPKDIHDDPSWYHQHRGQDRIQGYYLKTSTASGAQVYIYDGSYTLSSAHSGGGTYEFLTVTDEISSSATDVHFGCKFTVTGTYYISMPRCYPGTSVGSWEWAYPSGERINLDTHIVPSTFSWGSFSDSGDTEINLEADCSGKLSNVDAVYCWVGAQDPAAASVSGANQVEVMFDETGTGSTAEFRINIAGEPNNTMRFEHGWIGLDTDGNVKYQTFSTGAGTLDVGMQIKAVILQ